MKSEADEQGRFGEFGGRWVPEVLIAALDELSHAYATIGQGEGFRSELDHLLTMSAQAQKAEAEEKQSIRELEKWSATHDMRVRAVNAEQYERLKALERAVYGKAVRNESDN